MHDNVTITTAFPPSEPFPTPPDASPPAPMLPNVTGCYVPPNAPRVTSPFPLTDRQRRAAALLALGRPDRDVCAELQISRMTLYRWRARNPAFRAELARRRSYLWYNSADGLRALMPGALKVLAQHLKSNYDRTSFRAAVSVLRLAGANKIAPPDDPTSEIEIMRREVLRDRARDGGAPGDTIVDQQELLEKYNQLLAECAPDHAAPEYEI